MEHFSGFRSGLRPRHPGTRRSLTATALWGVATIGILLLGGDSDAAAFLGTLLLLAIATVLARQILQPEARPQEPEGLYELHGAMAITFVVSLGILLITPPAFPFLFPASGSTFAAKPGMLLLLVVSIKSLALLQRGMQIGHRLRGWTSWAVAVTFLTALIASIGSGFETITYSIAAIACTVTAILLFFRGLRNDWVVRLQREGKYRLAGLSLLAILGSIGWHIVIQELIVFDGDDYIPIDRFIELVATIVAVLYFSWWSGILMRTIATLPTARAMDRRQNEVASLSSLGMMMLEEFDRDRLIRSSIDTAATVTGSQYVWIRLFDGVDAGYEEVLTGYVDPVPTELVDRFHRLGLPGSGAGTIGEVGRRATTISLFSVAVEGSLPEGTRQNGIILQGMIAVVPILSEEERRGALYLFTQERRGYDRDDRLMLETVAAQIALTVRHADLVQRSIERERLESEMQIAREAQERLLPATLPLLPCCELHALSQPASLVGGDYYDTIEFRDGTIGCIVADVAGKGAGAALYMGMVKGVVRGLSREVDDPVEFLVRINRALYRNIDPRFFVTMSVARILPDSGVIELVRAGHTPGLLIRPDRTISERSIEILPKGIGLALASEAIFERTISMERIKMLPGEVLALFSDGLTEARDPEGEEIGQEGLARLLEENVTGHPDSELRVVGDALVAELASYSGGASQHDDITLLLIRWGSRDDTPRPDEYGIRREPTSAAVNEQTTSQRI